MQTSKESFFRIFQSDLRPVLQRFFENRRAQITPEIAADFVDAGIIERLIALGLIDFDSEAGEYRLDDRTERFFDEMLGAAEIAQAEWLVGVLDEIRRSIEGYQKLANAAKG